MLHQRNDEKSIAAEDDEDVEFVPAAFLDVLPASLQPEPEEQVDAYRDVQHQLHGHEDGRLGHLEAIDYRDDDQTDADDQQAYVEVLALLGVVYMMEHLVKTAVRHVEELIGLGGVERVAVVAGALVRGPHASMSARQVRLIIRYNDDGRTRPIGMKLRRPITWRVVHLRLHVSPPHRLLLALVHVVLHLLQPDLLGSLALLVLVDHSYVFALVVRGLVLRVVDFLLVESD